MSLMTERENGELGQRVDEAISTFTLSSDPYRGFVGLLEGEEELLENTGGISEEESARLLQLKMIAQFGWNDPASLSLLKSAAAQRHTRYRDEAIYRLAQSGSEELTDITKECIVKARIAELTGEEVNRQIAESGQRLEGDIPEAFREAFPVEEKHLPSKVSAESEERALFNTYREDKMFLIMLTELTSDTPHTLESNEENERFLKVRMGRLNDMLQRLSQQGKLESSFFQHMLKNSTEYLNGDDVEAKKKLLESVGWVLRNETLSIGQEIQSEGILKSRERLENVINFLSVVERLQKPVTQ